MLATRENAKDARRFAEMGTEIDKRVEFADV
jgi:hypothetical protein